MVMVASVTLVSILVGSVTSTCLRSSFGDVRTFSAPMLPGSSGPLPGQSSTTSGLSAPTAGQATHNQVARETVDAIRFMVELLSQSAGRCQAGAAPRSWRGGDLRRPIWYLYAE